MYINIFSIGERNFISLDKVFVYKFYSVSFSLYINIFVYIYNFPGLNQVYRFSPGLYTHILIFHLSWTKHLIKLYINISFEVFKVNLF